MLSITTLVHVMLALLVLGVVVGLFMWLINYVAAQFPTVVPWAPLARVILVVCAVLVLIGVVLQLSGYPIIAF